MEYKSKDFIIEGSYLILNKEEAWKKIDKRMRTAVRKAQKYNPQVIEAKGNEEDIKKFAQFCPRADTLPTRIAPYQKMFFAYIGEELVGGLILTEIADNLFLQFNAVTESGRNKEISSFLIWRIVELFSNSKYKYLDVGASYRSSLQKYFIGWRTHKYPILMKPPDVKPAINISPFDNRFLNYCPQERADLDSYLKNKWQNREYTFFPRGKYAIYALIRWLALEGKIKQDDEICITTTSGSRYISGCVTPAIDAVCKWSQELNEKTRAVFAIHEFGFPHPELAKWRQICDARGIPLIEDCAYAWQSGDAGKYGDYLIYSLAKVFPMQFGGILVGKYFEPQYIWDNFACHDEQKEKISKEQLGGYLKYLAEYNQRRIDNYKYFESIFGKERSYFNLEAGVVPAAYVLRVENEQRMKEVSAYVRQFGVECGNFWHNNAVFLPIHQNLEKTHLDYIIGATLAMFRNNCGVYNLPKI